MCLLKQIKKKLPIGIENFAKLQSEDFYYVDKTRLIEQLLQNWGEVNLFTRPRRFGKTLNMSMLKSVFEIGTDKTLFDQLYKIRITAAKTSKYQKAVKYVTVKVK